MAELIAAGGWCAPSETVYDLLCGPREFDWDYLSDDAWSRVVAAANGCYPPLTDEDRRRRGQIVLPEISVSRGPVLWAELGL